MTSTRLRQLREEYDSALVKIIEKGNHIGLSAKDGVYKKLVDLQAF